jgi:plastocyanin
VRYFALFAFTLMLNSSTLLADELNINLVDNNNKPLKNMVVYLQPLDEIVLPMSNNVVEIGQLDRSFTPYISVMQLGNEVSFNNQDNITHHIYSPIGENKFSFKLRAGKSQSKQDFQQVGEVAMGCNIHDWMSGYLLIVDTPLFGKTNDKGFISFDISHAGQYEVIVWHPKLDSEQNRIKQLITWQKTQQLTIKIENTISALSVQENDDEFDFLFDY